MARIRTIKPEFWSSPDTSSCEDPWARLLFVAMWNWADDAGRGTANAKELAGFAFPNDEKIDSAETRRMLGEIRRAFGVEFYTVGGRPYYSIPSWDAHQKIDRRSQGKHPGPEEGEPWDPDPQGPPDQVKRSRSTETHEGSAETHESPSSPRRTPGAGTGEQGNRGITTSRTADATRNRDSEFDAFWAEYPKRVDKKEARKVWNTVSRTVPPDRLIAAARSYARTITDLQYAKYPATWLRRGSYDNEPETGRHLSAVPTPPLPADPAAAVADLRARADAQAAANLIGELWIAPPQPPGDRTPPQQYDRDQRVEWIDAHADAILAALDHRETG